MEPTETNKNKKLKEIKKGSISLSFFIIIHMSYNRQNEMSKISKQNVQKKEKRPS